MVKNCYKISKMGIQENGFFLLEILGLMHMYIFLWFFFMVKNCYKFSKMGFLVVFNDFSR